MNSKKHKVVYLVIIVFMLFAFSYIFYYVLNVKRNDLGNSIESQMSIELERLQAEIVAVKKTDQYIIINFTLKNNTAMPIRLYERWNSWGYQQWGFDLIGTNGKKVRFRNPQATWTMNFPSVFEIKPHDQHVLNCALILKESAKQELKGYHIFTTLESGEITHYPIWITGDFRVDTITRGDFEGNPKPNWTGLIFSNTISIK